MSETEKQFESDIEAFPISPDGGWTKASDADYRSTASTGKALDLETLVGFILKSREDSHINAALLHMWEMNRVLHVRQRAS